MDNNKRNLFIDKIEQKENNNVNLLINKLKSKKISLDNLSEIQKNKIYESWKEELIIKKTNLQKIEENLFKNYTNEINDIDFNNFFNNLSDETKHAFIIFLKNI